MPAHIHADVCLESGGGINLFCTCPHCTLCVCKVCGCYEGSLTTDCPDVHVDFDKQEEIYRNGLDYTDEIGWYTRGTAKELGWPKTRFLPEKQNA